MNDEIKIACQILINKIWTLEYKQVSPNEIEIVSFSRDNPRGFKEYRENELCDLAETEDRTITYVDFAPFDNFKCWADETNTARTCKVANPKHIFDYPYNP
jgi:hypothetical protein